MERTKRGGKLIMVNSYTADDTVTISANFYNTPSEYIKNLLDEELIQCLEELQECNRTGVLTDGRVRLLAKKISNQFSILILGSLTYVKNTIFEEAAYRWLNKKKNTCCKGK